MELYTAKDLQNRKKHLALIVERMQNTNYRLIKSQMKQCVADVIAYAAKEDDYEIGERFLKRIVEEFHKGRIYIKKSLPGKGTTFRIELKK
jgi:hypothetical protein